jgi:hypothetical protein
MSYHDRPRPGDGGPADDDYDDSPSTAELRGEVRDTIEAPGPCDDDGHVDSPLGLPIEGTQPPRARMGLNCDCCGACGCHYGTDSLRREDACRSDDNSGCAFVTHPEQRWPEQSALEAAWAEFDAADATWRKDCQATDAAEVREAKSSRLYSLKESAAEAIGPRPKKDPS